VFKPVASSEPAIQYPLWTPIGWLGLHFVGACFTALTFESDAVCGALPEQAMPVAEEIFRYFENPEYCCRWRWPMRGTPFQQTVLLALRQIPPGQIKTYGQLAHELGSAPRAIGQALRRNPFPIFFPCHRVVAQRSLGGFAGHTDGHLPQVKAWLLAHEGGDSWWSDS